jgi:uncharacterized membrane protein
MGRINVWIVLLLVSVLANGVLIGAGARTWFSEEAAREEISEARRGGFQLRAFVEALPEDERRTARAQAREARQEFRGLVREVALTRRAAAEAMLADPFDQQAAADALAQAREARAALERATETRILEIAAGLEPEERRAAFEAAISLPERTRRPGPPPRRDRPGPPPGE